MTISNGLSQCEANEDELFALKDQARKDLMDFWVARTTEMKTGNGSDENTHIYVYIQVISLSL